MTICMCPIIYLAHDFVLKAIYGWWCLRNNISRNVISHAVIQTKLIRWFVHHGNSFANDECSKRFPNLCLRESVRFNVVGVYSLSTGRQNRRCSHNKLVSNYSLLPYLNRLINTNCIIILTPWRVWIISNRSNQFHLVVKQMYAGFPLYFSLFVRKKHHYIIWKTLPHYLPWVSWIHRSPTDSTDKGPVIQDVVSTCKTNSRTAAAFWNIYARDVNAICTKDVIFQL